MQEMEDTSLHGIKLVSEFSLMLAQIECQSAVALRPWNHFFSFNLYPANKFLEGQENKAMVKKKTCVTFRMLY